MGPGRGRLAPEVDRRAKLAVRSDQRYDQCTAARGVGAATCVFVTC